MLANHMQQQKLSESSNAGAQTESILASSSTVPTEGAGVSGQSQQSAVFASQPLLNPYAMAPFQFSGSSNSYFYPVGILRIHFQDIKIKY